MKNSNRFMK